MKTGKCIPVMGPNIFQKHCKKKKEKRGKEEGRKGEKEEEEEELEEEEQQEQQGSLSYVYEPTTTQPSTE